MELVGFDGVEWDHAGLPRHPRLVVAFLEPLLRHEFVETSNILTDEMAVSLEAGELKVCDSVPACILAGGPSYYLRPHRTLAGGSMLVIRSLVFFHSCMDGL